MERFVADKVVLVVVIFELMQAGLDLLKIKVRVGALLVEQLIHFLKICMQASFSNDGLRAA